MTSISDYFGSKVFDDRVMKARLSPAVYNSLRKTVTQGEKLDPELADSVAAAMKE